MTKADTMRILLCRPEGGLNDMLCQIQKCYKYAKRWKRVLIIDTNYAGAKSFKDKFSKYFNTNDSDVYLDADKFETLELMQVHPSFLQGRVNTYRAEWSTGDDDFIDTQSKKPLKLSFKSDHPEQLLVHHGAGGGEKSVRAFSWLKLNANLLDEITWRIKKIGGIYTGIHIRHTDYRTDYQNRVLTLAKTITGPVYIASDNRDVIDFCSNVFGKQSTFNFSKLPTTPGKIIHIDTPDEGISFYDLNRDAIADLFILAMAKKLYFFNLLKNNGKPEYSGFSRLAGNLNLFYRYAAAIGGANSRVLEHLNLSISNRLGIILAISLWKISVKIKNAF